LYSPKGHQVQYNMEQERCDSHTGYYGKNTDTVMLNTYGFSMATIGMQNVPQCYIIHILPVMFYFITNAYKGRE